MKTVEEELKMLKTAHSRLLNQYKELEKYINVVSNKLINLDEYVQKEFIQLNNTRPVFVKNPLLVGSRYIECISEIISTNEVQWQGSPYNNYEIKLKDREELYTVFISSKYKLEPKLMIKFFYSGEGKLSGIKL